MSTNNKIKWNNKQKSVTTESKNQTEPNEDDTLHKFGSEKFHKLLAV